MATDSDSDGLPDELREVAKGLDAKSGDSDGDGIPTAKDDGDGNGVRDLRLLEVGRGQSLEYRCTIPDAQARPKPIAYFNTGTSPRAWSVTSTTTAPPRTRPHPLQALEVDR